MVSRKVTQCLHRNSKTKTKNIPFKKKKANDDSTKKKGNTD